MSKKIKQIRVGKSPVWTLITAIALVFFAEFSVMLLIRDVNQLPFPIIELLDPLLVSIILFPLLYIIVYQPLSRKNSALGNAEQQLTLKIEELSIHHNVLQELVKDLEREGRYKSRFLANMSHELRSPLNSILIQSNSSSRIPFSFSSATQDHHRTSTEPPYSRCFAFTNKNCARKIRTSKAEVNRFGSMSAKREEKHPFRLA